MLSIHIKHSTIVKPAALRPDHFILLSDLDVLQPLTHVPLVYFYRPDNTTNTNTFFCPGTLKNALSKALVLFYPLAGRLSPAARNRLNLHCNSAGATFIEAECNADIDYFGDFKPTQELASLVPTVDYESDITTWPLLLVQLTTFRCGGVCLGIAVKAIDGRSENQFVSAWAEIVRTGKYSDAHPRPVFDPTALRARDPPVGPMFDHEEFKPPPKLVGGVHSQQLTEETTAKILKLTGQQVESLKLAANKRSGGKMGQQRGRPYSRFEAVVAHVWRCSCLARRLDDRQLTKLYMNVDGRSRVKPPLPQGYFGNVGFVAVAVASVAEFAMEDGVKCGASKVREAVEKMRDEYLKSALEFLNSKDNLTLYRRGAHTKVGPDDQACFYGSPNLVVTSWLGMNFFYADFGWGTPLFVGPAGLGFDGKVFLVASVDEREVLVVLRLEKEAMRMFKKVFYDRVSGATHQSYL